jgi:hypothetical protein
MSCSCACLLSLILCNQSEQSCYTVSLERHRTLREEPALRHYHTDMGICGLLLVALECFDVSLRWFAAIP